MFGLDAQNLDRAFAQVTEHWSPKVIARVNDQYVKVAKVKGEFSWHQHDGQDELFWVVKGRLTIRFEQDRAVTLGPGELYVVPRNTRHCPVADEETWIVLIEPVETKHTGDVVSPLTKTIDQQLR